MANSNWVIQTSRVEWFQFFYTFHVVPNCVKLLKNPNCKILCFKLLFSLPYDCYTKSSTLFLKPLTWGTYSLIFLKLWFRETQKICFLMLKFKTVLPILGARKKFLKHILTLIRMACFPHVFQLIPHDSKVIYALRSSAPFTPSP